MAVDWSKVPAGKSYLDRRTIGGEVKYWDPGNPLLFGKGGSWQSQGALDTKRRESGLEPISQTQEWKKSSWNKPVAPAVDTSTQLSPAERATKEREELKVVKGGKSGYRSLMPKPTQQKGETDQQLQQRTDRWNRSQQLANRLTQQVKDQQLPAATSRPAPAPEQQAAAAAPAPAAATSTAPTTTPAAPAPKPQAPAPRQQAPAPAPKPQAPAPKPQAPAQTGDRTKDLTTWALANKGMIGTYGTKSQREILKAAQTGGSMPAPRPLKASLKDSYDYDAFDFVLEYLLSDSVRLFI